MKKFTLFFVFILCVTLASAQSSWKKIDLKNHHAKTELIQREHQPTKYNLFNLSVENFKSQLSTKSKNGINIIQLPNASGTLEKFSVTETANFEKELAEKFPNIKTYTAKGVNDKTATAKISIGTDGVHVIVFSAKYNTLYIDPYNKKRTEYIAYERKNLQARSSNFECLFDDEQVIETSREVTSQRNANDGKLRTYRLALACTGEYSQFHLTDQGIDASASDTQKKAAILSAMNTTMTRVNGVYERELSVTMIIVADNDKLIFLDANSDGLSNNSAGSLINESQQKCDNLIGAANYDIGHTFSTGGGGLAGLGVVCKNGQKGRGITGSSQPKNDPYDIDYVAHEMGHQFGGPHTFNNACGGHRSEPDAVEPGSGSTIMAYAGICSPNVQSNSNDYFHAVSIASIWNTIQSTATCATETNTNNTAPTANAGSDVSVPKSTPLVLRGIATDADGTSGLTHNWDQIDNEIATAPPAATSTAGPSFRSLAPTESPNRYLPALPTVIGGSTSSTWEVIPSVAREMNFAYTVRDNHSGGGASARDDIKITVTNAEPFTVTSQNSATTWYGGATATITWNKSTTDQAPINCANVRIKLSTDGGLTFPITLVESTPNDGSHNLVVPNHPTANARIMVEAVGNIFYNVNSTNFTIKSTEPTFVFTNTTSETQSVCNNSNNTATYTLNLDFINGFNETVSFSAENAPTGATVTFSPTTLNADGNVTMTVSNLNGVNAQSYLITVKGNSTSVNQTTDANLRVYGASFSNIGLTSPTQGATDISVKPQLTWGADSNATSYDLQVASDNAFANIVLNTNVTSNSYTFTSSLMGNTTYYWRVKPKNKCIEGGYSSIGNFTTIEPSYCTSTFNYKSEYISNVTFNTINNDSGDDHDSGSGDGYEDFTNVSTTVKRGEEHQISVTLNTFSSFKDHCFVFIDWNKDYEFNNTNERYDLGTFGGSTGTSTATMNITVPSNAVINSTRMRVIIEYSKNGTHGQGACDSDHLDEYGETEDYTIVIEDFPASVTDNSFNSFNLYPNPSNGKFNLRFDVIDTQKVSINLFDMRGRLVERKTYKNTSSTFNQELIFDKVDAGLYLLQIANGNKQTTRKIIIK